MQNALPFGRAFFYFTAESHGGIEAAAAKQP